VRSSGADLSGVALIETDVTEIGRARRVTFLLQQRFTYSYDRPVQDIDHRLMVIPRRRHGDACRRLHQLQVSAADARTTVRRDRSGNVEVRVLIRRVAESVTFQVAAVVERVGAGSDVQLPTSALTDPRLLRPTARTTADEAIATTAHSLAGRDRLETAERLCAYVHSAIRYEYGATSVATTAAEALAGGRGVCQDSAHIMIALCRQLRLPARYVSGHLLGEGGTHAWVEVIVPHGDTARGVAFDPCNGRRAGAGYLTVAVGRDYGDVAPTSGTYSGAARGQLTASKRVGVTAIN
jgi:transglutaminase-like putative cysteine protease